MSSIPDRPAHHKAPPVRGEFETELRHRCRQCRSKLAVPVENQHQAFCTKGCHSSFYLRRCLICELPLKKKTVRREVCSRRDCQNAFRGNRDRFRYKLGLGTSIVTNGSESPIQSGIKIAHAADRPWRQITGPELSANAFHCAMVGADEAVEAACRINSRHWREAGRGRSLAGLIRRSICLVDTDSRTRQTLN